MTRDSVLITGGSRGVGYALAAAWLARGARVLITGRDAARLDAAAARLRAEAHGGEVLTFAGDLADDTTRAALITHAGTHLGALTALVNNAAIQVTADLAHGDPSVHAADAAREIATNLTAPVALALLALPLLRAGADARGHATIVNITSGLALAPKAAAPVYCGTKAALRTVTTALRWQFETTEPRLRVVEAMLPLVDTDMTTGRGRGKLAPDAVARVILAGLDAGRSYIPVGRVRLLRALLRVAPSRAEQLLRHG